MKKHNNPATTDIENVVDTKSQNAVTWFSSLPLSSVNTEKIWQSIEKRLDSMDKKLLTWFMAMTTSFTLLVAAGLEFGDEIFLFEKEPTIVLPESDQLGSNTQSLLIKSASTLSTLNKKVNKVMLDRKSNLTIDPIKIESDERLNETLSTASTSVGSNKLKSHPGISFRGEIDYTKNQFLPGVGVDFKLYEFAKNGKNHSIHIGWTTNYMSSGLSIFEQEQSEQEEPKQSFLHYVKAGYGLTTDSNKGWQIESGYLLNPDGEIFNNTTIKMTVHRKVNRHLRIGPEIIFTDNFNKVLPSVSVLFSS